MFENGVCGTSLLVNHSDCALTKCACFALELVTFLPLLFKSSLGPIYYRDSQGAVLVYDITDRNSFTRVQNWVKELRKMLGKDIVLAIAGNKIDLEKSRSVSIEEAEAYAKDVGAVHYSTSAKLNKGITEMFTSLSERMFAAGDSEKAPEEVVPIQPRGKGKKGLTIDESSGTQPSSSSSSSPCCGS